MSATARNGKAHPFAFELGEVDPGLICELSPEDGGIVSDTARRLALVPRMRLPYAHDKVVMVRSRMPGARIFLMHQQDFDNGCGRGETTPVPPPEVSAELGRLLRRAVSRPVTVH